MSPGVIDLVTVPPGGRAIVRDVRAVAQITRAVHFVIFASGAAGDLPLYVELDMPVNVIAPPMVDGFAVLEEGDVLRAYLAGGGSTAVAFSVSGHQFGF
jgi:hypothetical protein